MERMYVADRGSTAKRETSRFQALVEGKTWQPPRRGGAAWAAGAAAARASAATTASAAERLIEEGIGRS
jgi:hypothetical protein